MGIVNTDELDTQYTDIDLNSTGTTAIASVPSDDVTDGMHVMGVYLKNGGSTAEVQLEVTDGSKTSVLAVPGAGNNLTFEGDVALSKDDTLQINVTTVEGSAQTNTAAVSRGNRA